MASFRLLIVSMSDWSINCHIFSTLRDLDDKENLKCQLVKPDILCQCVQVIFNKKKNVHLFLSTFKLVSDLKPESSQELHDAVVVSHVPTAFSNMDQVGENFSLLLHGPCCQDQPRHPRAHLLIKSFTYNITNSYYHIKDNKQTL